MSTEKIDKVFYTIFLLSIGLFIGVSLMLLIYPKENATATATENSVNWVEFYDNTAEELELLKVYNSADLTAEILENRNGDLIIEKVYGICIDDEGNGRQLDSNRDFKAVHSGNFDAIENNYYISYSNRNIRKGDIVLSYMIYNTDNNAVDDITDRYDYIMDSIID